MKKIVSTLLVLVILFTMVPITVFAAEQVTINEIQDTAVGYSVTISGTTALPKANIYIYRPNGSVLDTDALAVTNGTFSYTVGLADTETAGAYTAVVGYGSVSASRTFQVTAALPTSIEIQSLPAKTEYIVGESLDLSGLIVKVNYNIGEPTTLSVTPEMVSGFDSSTAGSKTVTITYDGFTAQFQVNVRMPVETGIQIQTLPAKTAYVLGESLDLTGLVVKVNYDIGDPTDLVIMPEMVSGFDSSTIGSKTVAITYKSFTVEFDVTVGYSHTITATVSKNSGIVVNGTVTGTSRTAYVVVKLVKGNTTTIDVIENKVFVTEAGAEFEVKFNGYSGDEYTAKVFVRDAKGDSSSNYVGIDLAEPFAD